MTKNPFPGMNPYIESRWGDVHTALCALIRAALQPVLPQGLRARAEERVLLAIDNEPYRFRQGGAVIIESPKAQRSLAADGGVAVAAPVLVELAQDVRVHRWIKIIDAGAGGRVVTIIEVLSPWNKERGRTDQQYAQKVDEYLSSDVNFVEIDLLRSSRRHLMVQRESVPPERRADYLVCVNRPRRRAIWEVYPLSLREPLPAVPIPCRESDPDVLLSLQPLLDRIYVEGGHDDIDYGAPLDPPLSEDDRAWAEGVLAKHDLR